MPSDADSPARLAPSLHRGGWGSQEAGGSTSKAAEWAAQEPREVTCHDDKGTMSEI